MESTVESPGARKPGARIADSKWATVREDYLASEIGLRELAVKHGMPYPTIRDRCVREGWATAKSSAVKVTRSAVAKAVSAVTDQRVSEAVSKATATASLTATALINRTLRSTDTWLDRIDRVADAPQSQTPDAIRKLTGSWKDVISVARLTHGLDQTNTTVNIAVFGKPAAVESEPLDVVAQVLHSPDPNPPSGSDSES